VPCALSDHPITHVEWNTEFPTFQTRIKHQSMDSSILW
jgi:hypothetical protein